MRCSLGTRCILVVLSLWSGSGLFAQSASKKVHKAAPVVAPVVNSTPEPARVVEPSSTGDSLDFAEGRLGMSFGFPDGGSPMGAGFVGGRYFLDNKSAVGGYLLLGSDSSANTNSFGLAGRYTSYCAQRDRVHIYWFGQLSLGKNGGSANKGKDDTLFGLGGGAGVEFALLKDFSISAEGGLGYNTLPASKNAYATGTSKFAVNFYY